MMGPSRRSPVASLLLSFAVIACASTPGTVPPGTVPPGRRRWIAGIAPWPPSGPHRRPRAPSRRSRASSQRRRPWCPSAPRRRRPRARHPRARRPRARHPRDRRPGRRCSLVDRDRTRSAHRRDRGGRRDRDRRTSPPRSAGRRWSRSARSGPGEAWIQGQRADPPAAIDRSQSVATGRPIASFQRPSSTNRRNASSTGPRRLSRA